MGRIAGYVMAGLFFLRFWTETRDRLFATFAGAFWILAVQRAVLTLVDHSPADRVWIYGLRVLAFIPILVAILDKNRGEPRLTEGCRSGDAERVARAAVGARRSAVFREGGGCGRAGLPHAFLVPRGAADVRLR